MKQQVYIFGCEGATILLEGKAKNIVLDSCKRSKLIFDAAVSSVEIVNCTSVQVQCKGRVPSVAIDKTDGCLIYISWEGREVQFVTSKSSEMNVAFPKGPHSDDCVETPIPEQFVHKIMDDFTVSSDVSSLFSHCSMTPTLEEDVGPATLAQGVAAPTTPVVSYASGKEMMAQGPMVLHQDIAAKVERALGCAFPQVEVRFKHVSLAADLVTLPTTDQQVTRPQDELPTLSNQVMKAFASLSAKKNSVRKHILQDVTGSFRPGTTTLVLGQSGSGKSALMKLLSGRFPMDKEITMEGEMLYNGVSREKLLKRLPQLVNYVTQTDTHLPTLTVRETLEFASECCGVNLKKCAAAHLSNGSLEANAVAINAARSFFQFFPDIVLQSLGLQNCEHTIVGDAMYRGISGGEKRRVTTGEMEFGLKFVTLLDEISTGLDS
ncbi:hypothetical protein BBJ28_00021717, partial [Nothophytophthora sp. Chile5]